jgi:hypothetical protein
MQDVYRVHTCEIQETHIHIHIVDWSKRQREFPQEEEAGEITRGK